MSGEDLQGRAHALVDEIFSIGTAAGDVVDPKANEKAYDAWCKLSEIFGPVIAAHLQTQAVPGKITGSKEHRAYVSDVIARLLYDLAPAIEDAFPGKTTDVHVIITDLIDPQGDNDTRLLRRRPSGVHKLQMEKARARALIYEATLHEQKRLSLSTWEEAINTVFEYSFNRPCAVSKDLWVSMRKVAKDFPSQTKLDAKQPHPFMEKPLAERMKILDLARKK
ncbi:MAG: hypothetical protein J0H18_18690 [Rhizobiales bacterium]|nr:hypothetical protein [Hyphomicrobiales bacterium]OJX98913.1 MAG: hypothetical protein BGP07_13120 [Rhizobiales bacterium 63-22]